MATYGTDLNTFSDAESGSWFELTATSPEAWNVGDNPTSETDFFIQGAGCRSSDTNNKTGICSGVLDMGSDQSGLFTGGETVVLIWHVMLPGNAIDTYANDGLRAVVGSSLTDFWWWTVGGRDKGRNPYGGWQNYAVDPSKTAGRTSVGTPSGAYRYFGAASDVTSNISKGTMHGWDAIRYGRGEIYATGTGATFVGIAQYNDYNDATNGYRRYGLFQAQAGAYLWKGLLSLGQTGTSVTFSDSNRVISVDDTPHAYPTFNKIEINNSGSSVTWNNISFVALGTYAPGILEVVDNATVAFNGCSFSGMGTFTFLSNSDILGCVFYRCSTVTPNSAVMTASQVLESSVAANASALVWDDALDPDGYLDDMTFSKGTNDHHAIELGTATPTEVTLRNITFTGFSSSNNVDSSVVHVKRTTGAVTINAVGCTGTVSYRTDGAEVTVVVDPVALEVHVEDINTGADIPGARVFAYVTSGIGGWPYRESVGLSRTGSIVTVTHSGHGLISNDSVVIDGANEIEYNGVHTITASGTDYYTYTITGTPDSPGTGPMVSTFAIINGYTDINGDITGSKSYDANQPFAGRVRFASYPASGLYKSSPLTGIIDKTKGISITALLIPDD